MKKRVVLALASVVVTLGLAGVALYSQAVVGGQSDEELEASLAASASLDDGPAPAVASSYDLSAHQTLSRVVILIITGSLYFSESSNPYLVRS